MGVRHKTQWTEERIQDKLRLYFLSNTTKKYELFGRFVYDWESDYLAITKSGYVYEVEIKISRSDFFHDQKKINKHLVLEAKETDAQRPNYLYYAVPDGLVNPEEIPNGYGLLYVHSWGVDVVKKAEILHKEKVDIEKLNLIDKFYYTMWDFIDKYRKSDIKALKNKVKNLEKTIHQYDQMLSDANQRIHDIEEKTQQYDTEL